MTTFTEQMQERAIGQIISLYSQSEAPDFTDVSRLQNTLIADTITATLKEVERVVEGETTITRVPDNAWNNGYFEALGTIKAKIGALSKVTGE